MLGGSIPKRLAEQLHSAVEQLRDTRAVSVGDGRNRKSDHPHRPSTGTVSGRRCGPAATRVVHLLVEDGCNADGSGLELFAPGEVVLNDCPRAVVVALKDCPIGPDWTGHSDIVVLEPPNGSRLSCGRLARRRKGAGRKSCARQGTTQWLPLERARPPASSAC